MRFQCTACKGIVSVNNKYLGHKVQCGHCKEVVSVPDSRVAPGAVIADFIIQKELGRGGMGVVYLSHQISLDRPSALKVLSSTYANDSQFIVSFIREARAAAKLNHPHIVQAYAVGEDDGIFYFAMENIDGQTMKAVLKKQQMIPCDQAIIIIQQIAEALSYAWQEQKLIHRDIKPDNIMLTENGKAKLSDFGLASFAGEIDDSESDEIMGTPQYISPEHLTGAPMDTRSDIYSLGATFYHFVTGRFPYEGKNAAEIARQHLTGTLVPPHQINPNVPESVSQIIVKMMARNPVDRYQTAEELIEDLRAQHKGMTAPAINPMTTSSRAIDKKVITKFVTRKVAKTTGSIPKGKTTVGIKKQGTARDLNMAGTTMKMPKKQGKSKTGLIVGVVAGILLVVGGITYFATHRSASVKTAAVAKEEPLKPSKLLEELEKVCAHAKYNQDNPVEILENCEKILANEEYIPQFPGLADEKEDMTKLSPAQFDLRDREKTKFKDFVRYYNKADEPVFAKIREKLIQQHEEAMAQVLKQKEAAQKAEEAEANRIAVEKRKVEEAARAKKAQEDAVKAKRNAAKTDIEKGQADAFKGILLVCDGTEKNFDVCYEKAKKFLTDYQAKLAKYADDPDTGISKPAKDAQAPVEALLPRFDNAKKLSAAIKQAKQKSAPAIMINFNGKQMKLWKGRLWEGGTGKQKVSDMKAADRAYLYQGIAEHEQLEKDLWLYYLILGQRTEAENAGKDDPDYKSIMKWDVKPEDKK